MRENDDVAKRKDGELLCGLSHVEPALLSLRNEFGFRNKYSMMHFVPREEIVSLLSQIKPPPEDKSALRGSFHVFLAVRVDE